VNGLEEAGKRFAGQAVRCGDGGIHGS
jgi:hypothetical protein